MTGYGTATHAQMYEYVWSGDPVALHDLAARLETHRASIEDATATLRGRLASLRHSWQGTAADQFTGRFGEALDHLRQHADAAGQTGKAVATAADALTAAQRQMPEPPDVIEQAVADINGNPPAAAAAQAFTLGIANAASANAAQDVQAKHAQATQVMTRLAAAYAHAQAQLPGDGEAAANARTRRSAAVSGAAQTSASSNSGSASQASKDAAGGGAYAAAGMFAAGLGLGAYAAGSGAAGPGGAGFLAAGSVAAPDLATRSGGSSAANAATNASADAEISDGAGLAPAEGPAAEGTGLPAAAGQEGTAAAELAQMSGAGRGFAAMGGPQERGRRRESVREDERTWTSARHQGALPAGGVIE